VNVLRGEMSLVGPQPIGASELRRYGLHSEAYLEARPGLISLWQVAGKSDSNSRMHVECDQYYARRWSLWLDLVLLTRAVPIFLRP
jgi:exopolysaccharide production protein ExoY